MQKASGSYQLNGLFSVVRVAKNIALLSTFKKVEMRALDEVKPSVKLGLNQAFLLSTSWLMTTNGESELRIWTPTICRLRSIRKLRRRIRTVANK